MKGAIGTISRLSLSISLVLCAVLLMTMERSWAAGEPIKIGTIFSITGPVGSAGTEQKEVFTAMIDEINAKGGIDGRPLEFYYEDDKSSPTNAVIAATKLIRDRGVVAIVGTSLMDSALAIVPLCEKERVPFINSGPAYIPFKKWVFSVGPGDVRCATHLIDYAVKDLGAKRIALLHEAAAYGTLGKKVMTERLKNHPGVSFVARESMEDGDTTAIAQLTKIKSTNSDLLIIYMSGTMASVVAKNAKQLGVTTPILCGNSVTMPVFMQLAGKTAEENKWLFMSQPMMIAEKMSPDDPYRKEVYDPFKKLMQSKYGPAKKIDLFHGSSYDAIAGIVAAMKKAEKIDRASVRDALEKVNVPGFLGAFAPTTTDHQAARVDPMRPMTLKGGEYIPFVK